MIAGYQVCGACGSATRVRQCNSLIKAGSGDLKPAPTNVLRLFIPYAKSTRAMALSTLPLRVPSDGSASLLMRISGRVKVISCFENIQYSMEALVSSLFSG